MVLPHMREQFGVRTQADVVWGAVQVLVPGPGVLPNDVVVEPHDGHLAELRRV